MVLNVPPGTISQDHRTVRNAFNIVLSRDTFLDDEFLKQPYTVRKLVK